MNRRNFLRGFLATATVVALAPLGPIVEVPINTATFESLIATTLKNYRSVIVDNITMNRVVWTKLRQCGSVSGRALVEPIYY